MTQDPQDQAQVSPNGSRSRLFIVSALILFLELACIRWLPAHVLFVTFFTNTVLFACFLGMSLGCAAAERRRSFLVFTPMLLAVTMIFSHGVFFAAKRFEMAIDVGHQKASPQHVFFGTETPQFDAARFVVPIEWIVGAIFLMVAMVMVGPGQELGRQLSRFSNRVEAYGLNILGSLVGILSFSLCSWYELGPLWWFSIVSAGLVYLLLPDLQPGTRWLHLGVQIAVMVLVVFLSELSGGLHAFPKMSLQSYLLESARRFVPGAAEPALPEGTQAWAECFWSPYYRINYVRPPFRSVSVNLIGHQHMASRDSFDNGYAVIQVLNRDSGRSAFKDVLVIGAGTGNDVSRALQWGAEHVDAVEIDPVIYRLGKRDHPDHPYDDPRVTIHLNDGRNFLQSTQKKYDLIIYALVDSLVLQSSYSNIRLESYLFTQQALQDVRNCLKPKGLFVSYNYFRQGWIVARLSNVLAEVFGADNPVVLPMPYRERIEPEEATPGLTALIAGDTEPFKAAFARHPAYYLKIDVATTPETPNGFTQDASVKNESGWQRFGIAQVIQPAESLKLPTDNWPFLYLRRPMVPEVTVRGIVLMAGLALALVFCLMPRGQGRAADWRSDLQMLLLGAGFMLLESKAVVQMALVFGSTWTVNSIVFFGVLVMILAANLLVLKVGPQQLFPWYVALVIALFVNAAAPLDLFLGLSAPIQAIGVSLLIFAPIFFAGIVFSSSFGRMAHPNRAFAANIIGAMLGGMAENLSMIVGFQGIAMLAVGFYLLSFCFGPRNVLGNAR